MTSDKSLSYTDRSQKFGLTTLETRRLRGDFIIITSHGENGSRPQRPLYPRNNDRVHFILHKILYYNTTVSDAMEI